MKNVGEMLSLTARLYPEKKGVRCGAREFTWKEMNERTNKLGNALLDLGLRKSDRVAMLAYNTSEYIEGYFACAKTGLIFVPLNFRLSVSEWMDILQDSSAKTLIVGEEFLETADEIKSTSLEHRIAIGRRVENALLYEELLDSSSPLEPMDDNVSEDDPVDIFYTSGTTGVPKGSVHTHRARLAMVKNLLIALTIENDDVHLVNVPPCFHIGGFAWVIVHVAVGARIVFSQARGFDPKQILETVEQEAITNLHLVPITIIQLTDYSELRKYNLGSLRLIYYSTAPMPPGPLAKAIETFGNIFVHFYGQTEAGPLITILGKKDHNIEGLPVSEAERRLRSCGRPEFGAWVKVVDENDEEVGCNTPGEIVVRNDDTMSSYLNKEDETRKALMNGWLHTGDMAYYDEDNYFYIVDRKKDMIISGGENIYPAEVEKALYNHPAVAECAVIGVPDDRWGEAVKAFVVQREGHPVSENEIIDFCKKNLASYKKPKTVEFVKNLPRNPQGKVLKAVLREKYWSNHERKIV